MKGGSSKKHAQDQLGNLKEVGEASQQLVQYQVDTPKRTEDVSKGKNLCNKMLIFSSLIFSRGRIPKMTIIEFIQNKKLH